VVLLAVGIIDWTLIVPLVSSAFQDVCLLPRQRLSLQQRRNNAPSAILRLASGLFLISLGGAWYLFSFNWLYSLALILLVLGAVAIAAGLRRK